MGFTLLLSEDLHEAMQSLSNSTSPGPDCIATTFFKIIYPHISYSLLNLFQSFIDNSFVPNTWKLAHITRIHKGKGKPSYDTATY